MFHSRRLLIALFLLFAFLVASFPQRWFQRARLTILSFLVPAHSVSRDVHGAVFGAPANAPAPGDSPAGAPGGAGVTDLQREVAELRESLIRVHSQNVELARKLQAVTTLVRQGFRKVPRIIEAGILVSADASDFHSTLLIDRGSRDGVAEGQPVVWGRHVVGKVVAVGPYLSRVRTVFDPGFRTRAMVARPPGEGAEAATPPAPADKPASGRLLGLLEGAGADGCEVSWILTEEQVSAGDVVVTVEEDRGRWPAGLIFGTITEASRAHGPYYRIQVRPGVDLATLASVFVLRLE